MMDLASPSSLPTDRNQSRRSRLDFIALLLVLAAATVAFYQAAGPPRLPPRTPSWSDVLITLQGSEPPLEALTFVFTSVSWAVLVWIYTSLALRLFVIVAEALARGAAWARLVRRLSDRLTLPIVRRIVDGAFVAVVLVHAVGRPTP